MSERRVYGAYISPVALFFPPQFQFRATNYTGISKMTSDSRKSPASILPLTIPVMFHFGGKEPAAARVNIAVCTQAQRQDAYRERTRARAREGCTPELEPLSLPDWHEKAARRGRVRTSMY